MWAMGSVGFDRQRCLIAAVGVAPCQCFRPAGNQTRSLGRASSMGSPSFPGLATPHENEAVITDYCGVTLCGDVLLRMEAVQSTVHSRPLYWCTRKMIDNFFAADPGFNAISLRGSSDAAAFAVNSRGTIPAIANDRLALRSGYSHHERR